MENLFSRPSSKLKLTTNQKIAAAAAVIALIWAVRQPWFPIQINLKSSDLASPSPQTDPNLRITSESTNKKDSDNSDADSDHSDRVTDFWEVSLDTNQFFYGRLDPKTADKDEYLKLTDVFYYQPGLQPIKNETIRLLKLGVAELHQPQDVVYINRSHVVAKQPLSSDSKVVKAIEEYQNK